MWKARLSGALFALPLLLMHGAAVGQQRGDPQAGCFRAEILLGVSRCRE